MMENNESMEQAAKPADNSDSINKNNDILIRTENLVKAYGNILAVDHLNLSIHRGSLWPAGSQRRRQNHNNPYAFRTYGSHRRARLDRRA